MAFKKQIIYFNEQGYQQAERIAQAKLNLLNMCIEEASRYIDVKDVEAFCKDMQVYTTKELVEQNKQLKDLLISDAKIMELLSVKFTDLNELERQFRNNPTKLVFKDGKATYKIDKNDYTIYTKNEKENKKLKAINDVIKALTDLEEFTAIKKGNINALTDSLIIGDFRTNSFQINKFKF